VADVDEPQRRENELLLEIVALGVAAGSARPANSVNRIATVRR
jgi:hypothetical protein